MAHLTLAGLSDDGKRLLLVSDKGVEFTLDVDDRLRAALRGDHARLGQLEITMDSTLRPRDIQARIRAGESPEQVAQAAQTSVDKIMAYAAPVLAERQHVAERAQRSSVRRRAGEGSLGGARTLGDAVSGHLRSLNVDPGTVEWDACRREDGRWTLTGEFDAGERSGIATFTFDAPGNYVVAEDDDGRWLIGEAVARPRPPRPAAPAAAPTTCRRPARAGSPPYRPTSCRSGDDAIEMVSADDGTPSGPSSRSRPTSTTPAADGARRRARGRAAGRAGRPGRADRRRPRTPAEPEPAAPRAPRPQEGPGLGPELGRDHVRRRQGRLSRSGAGTAAAIDAAHISLVRIRCSTARSRSSSLPAS